MPPTISVFSLITRNFQRQALSSSAVIDSKKPPPKDRKSFSWNHTIRRQEFEARLLVRSMSVPRKPVVGCSTIRRGPNTLAWCLCTGKTLTQARLPEITQEEGKACPSSCAQKTNSAHFQISDYRVKSILMTLALQYSRLPLPLQKNTGTSKCLPREKINLSYFSQRNLISFWEKKKNQSLSSKDWIEPISFLLPGILFITLPLKQKQGTWPPPKHRQWTPRLASSKQGLYSHIQQAPL